MLLLLLYSLYFSRILVLTHRRKLVILKYFVTSGHRHRRSIRLRGPVRLPACCVSIQRRVQVVYFSRDRGRLALEQTAHARMCS
ncbi:hypothetical protein PENSPDRAFT_121363 [Peniophora sp. CONT]|nr:hypothetical protein PENSPDRAFT_121363 [Peniophora sp. CONT]